MKFGSLKRVKDNIKNIILKGVGVGAKMANFGARLADVTSPISTSIAKMFPGGEYLGYLTQRLPGIIRAEETALKKISDGGNVLNAFGGYFKDIKSTLTN